MSNTLLSVSDLGVEFDIHQNKKWPWSAPQKLQAVNNLSFELEAGKTLGIVGESGCGKSTLIRAICGLVEPTNGRVSFEGMVIDYDNKTALRKQRRNMQMIFQDPIASLNPRMTVREIVAEPLQAMNISGDHDALTNEMLDRVGISKRNYNRYPHEFSGGQCQRIGIARALITRPKLLLCDEPVSALDVSIQAQVINLLNELKTELNLSLIFVAHDLSAIRHISDNILVMYLGGMMEYGQADDVVHKAMHPYTKALLSAVPIPDPEQQVEAQILEGELPSPLNLPSGCLFSTRCPIADLQCQQYRPETKEIGESSIACFHAS